MVLILPIDDASYRFKSSAQRSTHADEVIGNISLLHHSEDNHVYSGMLASKNVKSYNEPNVVIKLAMNKHAVRRLTAEHRIYTGKLSSLQGIWIPRYFGLYQNMSSDGPLACIILEYCGRCIADTCFFSNLSQDFKSELIDAVVAIHELGIVHGDITEENVLNHHNRPKLIDFDFAVEKKCKRRLKIHEGGVMPLEHKFKCNKLHELCLELGIWKPAFIHFRGIGYPLEWIVEVKNLANQAPKSWLPQSRMKAAYRAVAAHLQEWYPHQWERLKDSWDVNVDRATEDYALQSAQGKRLHVS